MKSMMFCGMLLTCFAPAKDVWYDASGKPVMETAGEAAGKTQPRDLIATAQPLMRVTPPPWDMARAQRRARWLNNDGCWPVSYWNWGWRAFPRFTYQRCAVPAIQGGRWNFSFRSPGLQVNFTR